MKSKGQEIEAKYAELSVVLKIVTTNMDAFYYLFFIAADNETFSHKDKMILKDF